MGQQRKDTRLIEAVAKRLKFLRAQNGLSQDTVFVDTDIHIARIETGKYNISITTLNALCKYYSVTLEEFFADGFADVQKGA
jgi:transcriptional regulator with XRE-family HTH domain